MIRGVPATKCVRQSRPICSWNPWRLQRRQCLRSESQDRGRREGHSFDQRGVDDALGTLDQGRRYGVSRERSSVVGHGARPYLKIADCVDSDINVDDFGSRTSSGKTQSGIISEGEYCEGRTGAKRLRRVVCSSKRSVCGFSTTGAQWHMCRRATELQKLCIGAFRLVPR